MIEEVLIVIMVLPYIVKHALNLIAVPYFWIRAWIIMCKYKTTA